MLRQPTHGTLRCTPLCQSWAVSAAAVTALVLGLLLLAAAATIAVLNRRLGEARAEAAELRAALETEHAPRGPRAVQAAGQAVRSVVETANRVREQGVRGMLLSSIDEFAAWATADRQEIVRVAAPDGTVSIMFSDIENSTALNSELGDEQWVKLLQAHDRLVHAHVERHRGHVVKSQGDGYMVVFPNPDLAIGASLGVQRALRAKRQRSRQLRRTPISVRIGVHSGTAIEHEGDYFGRNVAMAARVASVADGGQVLVTDEVAAALSDSDRLRLEQRDVMELKGLPGEHQLWEVAEV